MFISMNCIVRYIKIHYPPRTLYRYFTFVWFYNIMHWSFGEYWFTELCRYYKYWHISLYTFVNITIRLTRKIFQVLGSCHAHGGRCTLSKIQIFAWKLQFYRWQQILSFVLLEVTARFVHFFKINVCEILKAA